MACSLSPILSFDACSCDEPRSKTIPALTIKQPFASLIGWGQKTIETRSSKISYRGPLVICSGKKVFDGPSLLQPSALEYYEQYVEFMPQGLAIFVVDLVDCRPMRKEDESKALVPFVEGLFSWVLSNPIEIYPFSVRGNIGAFNIPVNEVRYRHF